MSWNSISVQSARLRFTCSRCFRSDFPAKYSQYYFRVNTQAYHVTIYVHNNIHGMTNIAVEMEEPFTNDRESFQRFLAAFCKRINDNEDDSDILPFRPLNRHLTLEELQGECFDWSLRYLGLQWVWSNCVLCECIDVTRRACHFTGVFCNIRSVVGSLACKSW